MQILSAFRNTLMTWSVWEPPGGGGLLNKVLYGEAPPRGPTRSEPFFIPFLTLPAKVPLSMISTYYRQMEPLS